MAHNIVQKPDNSWNIIDDRTSVIGLKVNGDNSVSRADSGNQAINILRLAANVADTETVTVGVDVFEFDSNATFTAGRIPVDVSGGLTPTVASAAFVTKFNSSNTQNLRAYAPTVNEIVIASNDPAATALACSETLGGTNNAFDNATMRDGAAPTLGRVMTDTRVPSTQEVAIGFLNWPLTFVPRTVIVQVRVTSSGAVKAWDGNTVIDATNKAVRIDNAGSTDWAATDTITIIAME